MGTIREVFLLTCRFSLFQHDSQHLFSQYILLLSVSQSFHTLSTRTTVCTLPTTGPILRNTEISHQYTVRLVPGSQNPYTQALFPASGPHSTIQILRAIDTPSASPRSVRIIMEQPGKRTSIQDIVEQSIEEIPAQDNMAAKEKTAQIEAAKQREALLTPPDSNSLRAVDSPSQDTDGDGIPASHALVQTGLFSAPQSRAERYTQQELDAAEGLLMLYRSVAVQSPAPAESDRLVEPELREKAKLHETKFSYAKAAVQRTSHIGPHTEQDIRAAGQLLQMSVEGWEKTRAEHAAERTVVTKNSVHKKLSENNSTSADYSLTSLDASTGSNLTPPTESSTAREASSDASSEFEYTPSVASIAKGAGHKRRWTDSEDGGLVKKSKLGARKKAELWELRPPHTSTGDIFCRFAKEAFNERGDYLLPDKERGKDISLFEDGRMLCPEDGPDNRFHQQEEALANELKVPFKKYQVCKYRFFLGTALLIEYNLRLDQRKKTTATPVKDKLLDLNKTKAQLFNNLDVNTTSAMFCKWQEFGWVPQLTVDKGKHVNEQCIEGYPIEVRKALMKEIIETENAVHTKGGVLVVERQELADCKPSA